jgi:predicted DNA-binding transcriptional regulator YafY
MPAAAKAQRWVDIIAALLASHFPLTFEQLARDVPAYLADGSVKAGQPSANLKRMFERDKKELRAFGVPIDTKGAEGDQDAAYQLRSADFYLPYLSVITPRGPTRPRASDRYGYRSLAKLTFEPDELVAVEEASRRARELGDPTLAADAESAMRKLAFDLPIDPDRTPGEQLIPPRASPDPKTLEAVGEALVHRKRISFEYDSMNSRSTGSRDAEPYGLFFLSGHWYLAARELDGDVVKNFRVSRMHNVATVNGRAGTPDYMIPPTFTLREHGRSRQAWELGDGDATTVVVEFRGQSGAAVAGAQLGTEICDAADQRMFRVRRMDVFARWLLSFAGEAVPISPPELLRMVADQLRATRALYERDMPSTDAPR